ncbi:MAG: aminotransferase class I/II-fold pyridoxal phosphate-dependent enzyme [Pseudomonadota bacterium]
MSDLSALARPEIVAMRGYESAAYDPALIRLNANESPARLDGDDSRRGLNWYPVNRLAELESHLGALFDQPAERLMLTRGTSEAIDLLIRAFCRPGEDSIVVCPPAFGMYGVYAKVQNTQVQAVPLTPAPTFDLDVDGIIGAVDRGAKIVFVTSPNNPTGNLMSPDAIDSVVAACRGRALLVVDAAYHEFAATEEPQLRYASESHVVVLRTLSKAYALAGTRCGALIGDPYIASLLRKIIAPYAFATPVVETILAVLKGSSVAKQTERIAATIVERERVRDELSGLPAVRRVFPSDANFLLTEFADPSAAFDAARAAGFLLRDFSGGEYHPNCLRLTVGSIEQNDAVLEALRTLP